MNSANDSDERETLYSALFQILDGLWFMKTEEQFGFDKALQIDRDVWKIFGQKEAQRLVKYYQDKGILKKNDSPVKALEMLLVKSLFNKTLKFHIEKTGEELFFWVDDCKTLAGMKKVGRPETQASTVCYEIGFTFYDSFAKAVDPAFTTECVFTPFTKIKPKQAENGVCGWHFVLGKQAAKKR
nr:DUF6125 family protein [Candidatus Sigynarchaeota archaeon]